MTQASVGSTLKMRAAYVDEAAGVAICVWDAPDSSSVEALFKQAGVGPESVREVTVYKA